MSNMGRRTSALQGGEDVRYFAHESLRPGQQEIIDEVRNVLYKRTYRGLILSADPGIGKESCMTSQCLSALEDTVIDKAIFTVPTDAGKINILKEFNAVKHGYKVVGIKSKDILCKWIHDKEDVRISPILGEKCGFELCKMAKDKCPYRISGCPYYIQKEEAQKADILVCDYNYIFSPFVKKQYGINEFIEGNNVALFIDECHKMPNRIEKLYAKQLSSNTLDRAINELNEFNQRNGTETIDRLKVALDFEIKAHFGEMAGIIEYRKLESTAKLINHENVMGNNINQKDTDKLVNIGNKIKTEKFENGLGIISYVDIVANFMNAYLKTKKYAFSKIFYVKLKDNLETSYLGWEPSLIGNAVINAISDYSKIIMYSGTCQPDKFKIITGLNKKQWRTQIHTPPRFESPYLCKRRDIIYTNQVFHSKKRSDKGFLKRIKTEMTEVMELLPKPIALVCTRSWYNNLGFSMPFLTEPETQEEVMNWLTTIAPQHEYIYFSPHGRVAQSVDMPYLKSILFLGLPYKQIDEISEERKHRIASRINGSNRLYVAGYLNYIIPTYESVVQSAMRGLRSDRDEMTVIYCDKRFKKNKHLLNSKNLTIFNEKDELKAELEVGLKRRE